MSGIRLLIYLFIICIILQISAYANAMNAVAAEIPASHAYKFRIYFAKKPSKSQFIGPYSIQRWSKDVTKVTFTPNYLEVDSSSYDTAQDLMASLKLIPNANRLALVLEDGKEQQLHEVPEPDLFQSIDLFDLGINSKVMPVDSDRRIPLELIVREEFASPDNIRSLKLKINEIGKSLNFKTYLARRVKVGVSNDFYIQIFVDNDIKSVTQVLQTVSTIPEIDSVYYNFNQTEVHSKNSYRVSIDHNTMHESFVHLMLFNGIEVYRLDSASNSVWIHFPKDDLRNDAVLKQIGNIKGVVLVEQAKAKTSRIFDPTKYAPIHTLKIPEEVVRDHMSERNQMSLEAAHELNDLGFIVTEYSREFAPGETPHVDFTYLLADDAKYKSQIEALISKGGKIYRNTNEGRAIDLARCEALFSKGD